MKRIQLLSAALILSTMAGGLSMGASAVSIGAIIVLVVVFQLVLEVRHARRAGEVCGVRR